MFAATTTADDISIAVDAIDDTDDMASFCCRILLLLCLPIVIVYCELSSEYTYTLSPLLLQ